MKFVNALVHPLVNDKFQSWCNAQQSSYIIYESALVFENESEDIFDEIICIKTPINIIVENVTSQRPTQDYGKDILRRRNTMIQK